MSEIEKYRVELQDPVALQRKQISERITKESDKLIDELLLIIYNDSLDEEGRPIVDAKTKLQAITMLLDRGVPKLGVEHTKSEIIEETTSHKKLRTEIEELIKKGKEQDA